MEFFEEAIRAHALGDSAITALIDQRWYIIDLPQGASVPAVTMQQISGVPEHNHSGHSGQENSRWQFTVWSSCYQKASRLSWAIERRFDAFRGQWGSPEQGWWDVGRCTKVGRVTMRNPEQKLYQIVLDFYITHRSYRDA